MTSPTNDRGGQGFPPPTPVWSSDEDDARQEQAPQGGFPAPAPSQQGAPARPQQQEAYHPQQQTPPPAHPQQPPQQQVPQQQPPQQYPQGVPPQGYAQQPPQQAPPQQEPPLRPSDTQRLSNEEASADALLTSIGAAKVNPRPEAGWRAFLYNVTNGRVNLGRSPEESLEDQLIRQIQTTLGDGVFHVIVWSQKGGVGKTTTTTALGVVTASTRTDKIVGIDVNPDGGSLAIRVPRTTRKTIIDLRDEMKRRSLSPVEFDRYVNHAPHRFDTIVLPPGKKTDHPLSADDHQMVVEALEERYPYKIVFTDCGTDLSNDVMNSVFATAHQLVVVTTTVTDEATVTVGGLEALIRTGREDLVRNAITILVEKAPRDPNADVQRVIDNAANTIKSHFERLTKTVVVVPYDSRIRVGEVFDLNAISKESRAAYMAASAAVIDSLAQSQ